MYIFISHSSIDAKIAQELCVCVEREGHRCFIAPRDIRSGYEYAEEIINGIDNADTFVLLLSENSNASPHVLREVERAVSKNIPIIVYKMEEVNLTKSMEYFLMTHQWINSRIGKYDGVIDAINGLSRKDNNINVKESPAVEGNAKKHKKIMPAIISVVAVAVIMIAALLVVNNIGSEDGNGGKDEKTTGESTNNGEKATGESASNGEKPTDVLVNDSLDIQLGDTVVFGEYLSEDIYWQVISISEDKKEAVLITKDIITMKAFDAAESGQYNSDGTNSYWSSNSPADTDMELQAYVRGNNQWSTSNIRTWLNSNKNVVKYEGQAPASRAMSEKTNGYEHEAGFLTNFSDEELEAIIESEVVTKGNVLSGEKEIVTKDKVFLLSVDELSWLEEADVNKLAMPTEASKKQDESKWYEYDMTEVNVKFYVWWLRDPVEGTSSNCYMVGNGYYEENIWSKNVGLEGFGIRPAIRVNLESGVITVED